MKKSILVLGLTLTLGMYVNKAEAQAITVHINIDRQPAWGPVGYDYASFYYFPELNIYFDVNSALFYYLSNRRWVSDYYLPLTYRQYDLYRMYKVVLNDHSNPWIHNRLHRSNYAHFSNNHSQAAIRSAKDNRYGKARSNTRAWVAPQQQRDNSQTGDRNGRQAKPTTGQTRSGQQGQSSKPDTKKEQQGRSSKSDTKKEQNAKQQSSSRSSSRSGR
jgi:hypothetical protein